MVSRKNTTRTYSILLCLYSNIASLQALYVFQTGNQIRGALNVFETRGLIRY